MKYRMAIAIYHFKILYRKQNEFCVINFSLYHNESERKPLLEYEPSSRSYEKS